MLTVSNDVREHDELIIDKGRRCTYFESGNPYLSGQEFIYSDNISEQIDDRYENEQKQEIDPTDVASSILKNNLESSIIRLNRHPKNPYLLNSLAKNYQSLGNYGEAISSYKKALELDPGFFPAKANLAKCYTLIEKIDEAIQLYEDLETTTTDKAVVYINIALLHLKKKEFDVALKYFENARELEGKNPSVWNNIGLIQLTKNDFNKGVSSLRKAYKLSNDDPKIANNLGVAFALQNNIKRAIHFFRISNQLKGNTRNTIFNLSLAYQLTNQHNKVISILFDYIREHETEVELRNILAWSFFQNKEYENARKLLTKALIIVGAENDKLSTRLLNNLAVIYDYLGEKNKAEQLMITSLEIDPKGTTNIHCNIIHFYLFKRDLTKAKERIDSAIEHYSNDPVFQAYLGEYYFFAGQYDYSKEIFYSVINKNSNILTPYVSLSTILADVDNNPEEALTVIEKIVPRAKNNVQIINNYAYILTQLGKLTKAREVLNSVDLSNGLHLTATKGLLLLKEGHLKEGRELYNKAKKLAGKDKNMANLVEQKKNLELGKFHIEKGKSKTAIRYLTNGLKSKSREKYYRKQLKIFLEIANEMAN